MSTLEIRLRISGSQLSYLDGLHEVLAKGFGLSPAGGSERSQSIQTATKAKIATSSPIIGVLSQSSVDSEGLQLQ